MAKYINIDRLKDMVEAKADTLIEGGQAFYYIAKWLDLLPGVEAVEVIRCKDCKYFNGKIDLLCDRCGDIDEPCGGCHYTGDCTYDDGYCHHGERRKEDGEVH